MAPPWATAAGTAGWRVMPDELGCHLSAHIRLRFNGMRNDAFAEPFQLPLSDSGGVTGRRDYADYWRRPAVMRALNWAEIRARAAKFADEWKGASYERGEAQSFYDDLFRVFGRDRRLVAAFERQVKRLGTTKSGYIDLLWPGTLIVEHKSAGYDLDKAMEQAEEYLASLPESELPRYLLACDFKRFLLVDLDKRTENRFALSDLSDNVGLFTFMAGRHSPATYRAENPVDVRASTMMGKIFTILSQQGYTSPHVERFLVRIAFCMFAEDTGIFEKGIFEEYVRIRTSPDGSDLGSRLANLFEVLDTAENERQGNLDDDLKAFPYVDGALFAEGIGIPACNAELRRLVLRSCEFDWSRVSPVIFGNLFQGVMNPEEKHREGAHYTTEENIMRVIRPLFLDGLENDIDDILSDTGGGEAERRKKLSRFQVELSKLRFLDPACGSGNFLIIAYREVRRLELRAIAGLHDVRDKRLDISSLSMVNVGQFFGIEKNEFSARIAEVGMWMMDHLMNRELGDMFGHAYSRIPIRMSPNIVIADALEEDWSVVLPPEDCSYVLGNPPFGGAKVMTTAQRRQIHRITSAGILDYVSGWFVKAARYASNSTRIGLVATSSIVQGEQVSQLWPDVLDTGLDIVFAHQQFKWGSDAKGKASVSVVIVGMARNAGEVERRLFYHGADTSVLEENPERISPYLIGSAGPLPLVASAPSALNGLPPMEMGSKAIDGGHYILDDEARMQFLVKEPQAEEFIRPFIGARQFLNGESRWIFALHDAEPCRLRTMPDTMKRIRAVREFRLSSKSGPTRELAATPTRYHLNVLPDTQFLVVPRVNAEHREYLPVGYMYPPSIPSDAVMVVREADIGLFGLMSSSMHMTWLRRVGGRLGAGLRYSKKMVYNTFPVPNADLGSLEAAARDVLDARSGHPDSTLADLYDPIAMPSDLRRAHRALDRKVDGLYRHEPFMTDMDRLEFLLGRYEELAGRSGGS